MQGSLSVTHVTNYKIKTEYVYFSSLTCTRVHLRAPIFKFFLGGHAPRPPYFCTRRNHILFFLFPPLLQNPVSIPVCTCIAPAYHMHLHVRHACASLTCTCMCMWRYLAEHVELEGEGHFVVRIALPQLLPLQHIALLRSCDSHVTVM